MALKDFKCSKCEKAFEEYTHLVSKLRCPSCKSLKIEPVVSAHAGYTVRGVQGSSTRPRYSGSFKGRKKI